MAKRKVVRLTKVTQARLREVLRYNPRTGAFTRRITIGRYKAGDAAGTDMGHYLKIMIDGERYASHRLAWLYVYGRWPKRDLDHINRNKKDNRIANLREATPSQNVAWVPMRRDNTSGIRGVCFHKASQKWGAQIGGKWLGVFSTKRAAAAACRAEHIKQFGDFSPLKRAA